MRRRRRVNRLKEKKIEKCDTSCDVKEKNGEKKDDNCK